MQRPALSHAATESGRVPNSKPAVGTINEKLQLELAVVEPDLLADPLAKYVQVIVPGLKLDPLTVTFVPARTGFGDSVKLGPVVQQEGVGVGGGGVGVGLGTGEGFALGVGFEVGDEVGLGDEPELGRVVGLEPGLGDAPGDVLGDDAGLPPGRGDTSATPATTRRVVWARHWPVQQMRRMCSPVAMSYGTAISALTLPLLPARNGNVCTLLSNRISPA